MLTRDLQADYKAQAAYTVSMNDVFFNLSSLSDELVRQIDEIIKRCEERKQRQVATCV